MDAAAHTYDRRDIVVRKTEFDLAADIPRYYYANNPWVTHFFNALSTLFPEGEKFFIDTVHNYKDEIDEPALKRDVQAFTGQEVTHASEHRRFNAWIEERGCGVSLAEGILRRGLNLLRRVLPHDVQLAVTCALEHFTAILAETYLRTPGVMEDLDDRIAPLWAWHAAEEMEHKTVAFDVFRAVGGSEFVRRGVMLIVTLDFWLVAASIQLLYMFQDRSVFRPRVWRDGFRWAWVRPGFARRMLPYYASYYRRDFHPRDIDNTRTLNAWYAQFQHGAKGVIARTNPEIIQSFRDALRQSTPTEA